IGYPLIFQRRLDEAGPYLERAVAFNPNDTFIHMIHAMWLSYAGQSAEALALMGAAFRRDPMALDWYWDLLAMAQTAAGLHTEALASYKRMVAVPPWGHAYMAICYGGLDRKAEARTSAARFVAESPFDTVSKFQYGEPYCDPAVVERLRRALLAA